MQGSPLRVFDLLDYHHNNFPDVPVYGYKKDNQWITIATSEYIELVNSISKGLLALGVKPNDKVGLISENRYEWNVVDFAVQQVGAVLVAVYPNISDTDYVHIFNHADVKTAFISNTKLHNRIDNLRLQIPALAHLFLFDETSDYAHWMEIIEKGKSISDATLESSKGAVKSDDLATLIYTSGTTGIPKGVMLTHQNLLSDTMSCEFSFPVTSHQKALSFLPVCHAYERVFHYVYVYLGLTIYYAQSLETIGDDMKAIKPHIFSAVPRVLEKVYEKIIATGNALTGIKKTMFFWSLKVAEKYALENRTFAYNLKLNIARKLIFSKWKAALGGEVVGIASGSAALQERLTRIYWAAGIPIYEGYGLTEAGPCLAVNDFKRGLKIGTVGIPLINIDIKLADDGEILAKGNNIMKGYYKDEEATAEVLKNGWLATGDIGQWIDGKYLKIIDRKKEMFKTSGGKYVVPQAIESKMVESPFIEQFMVVGEGEKFPAAFVVPSYLQMREWAKENAPFLLPLSQEEFLRSKSVKEKLQTEIESINQMFGKWEQIKKIVVIPNEFTIETGELTPTLKMKRKVIIAKYKDLYKSLY